jgi:hypothetical protein
LCQLRGYLRMAATELQKVAKKWDTGYLRKVLDLGSIRSIQEPDEEVDDRDHGDAGGLERHDGNEQDGEEGRVSAKMNQLDIWQSAREVTQGKAVRKSHIIARIGVLGPLHSQVQSIKKDGVSPHWSTSPAKPAPPKKIDAPRRSHSAPSGAAEGTWRWWRWWRWWSMGKWGNGEMAINF